MDRKKSLPVVKNVHYDKASQSLALAIDKDEAKQVKEAIYWYGDACEHVLLGLKSDPSPDSRETMVQRLKGWITRAEFLKTSNLISNTPLPPTKSTFIKSHRDPMDGVIGLENVKQALREAVLLPVLQPQLFVGERRPWKGILLFGPPGTGKTLLASAVAQEANCYFIAVSSSDLVSKYMGDSEKAVRDLFQQARESVQGPSNKRCVIFFDEIDSIGRARGGAGERESDRRLLTELLRQMDGIGPDNSKILVMGATNLPHQLDPALRRRFERRLYVPLPGCKARAQLLAKHLGPPGTDHELSAKEVARVAARTKGFSGADIASFTNEVLLRPVRTCLSATHFARTLDGSLIPCSANTKWGMPMRMLDKDFDSKSLHVPLANVYDAENALRKVKPSTNAADLTQLTQFASEYGETIDLFEEEKVSEADVAKSVHATWGPLSQTSTEWVGRAVAGISSTISSLMKKTMVPN